MITREELDNLKALLTKAEPLPWGIASDVYGGKEEAWCRWHSVGPLCMEGPEPDANGQLVYAVMQLLPKLIAAAESQENPPERA